MVLSALVIVLVVLVGTGLTLWAGVPLRLEERVAIGAVVGSVAFSAAGFVVFELVGMGPPVVLAGVAVPAAGGAAGWHRHRGVLAGEARSLRRRLGLPARHAASARPLAAFTALATAVSTRILALAYQTTDEGISAGNLAIWGDWAAHLAYAGSFAYGDNRALELPTAAGAPFKYHLLADWFAAPFTVTGLDLTQALVWTAWLLAVALPVLAACFVLRLSGSRFTAITTVVLFTLSGGVGVWYLGQDIAELGWGTLSALPQTYARMPAEALWVDNTISASLYAQRSTLLGVVTGLAAGIVLLAARPRWARSGFVFAGILVGTTGISHVHMLVSAVALGGLALLADRRRPWWWFLVPAVVVGAPLALAINPSESALRFLPGWMAPGASQSWPWFWFRNVGLLLPVFAAISLFGGVPRRIARLTAPLWLWFVVPNLVSFHPSEWNNTKFFLFWQFAGCLAIADFARGLLTSSGPVRSARRAVRVALGGVAVLLLASLVVTGSVDTVRAMQTASAIPWVATDEVEAATWLREHAEPGEVLVYGTSNTSAVAALSGVPALSGYLGWTDDLGLADAERRARDSYVILAGTDGVEQAIETWGVDYVVIGPRERYEAQASDTFWNDRGALVFSAGEYQIYATDREARAGPGAGAS
jgi:hypothetical protein